MTKIIDLTHIIYSGMPVYPGDPEVTIEQTHSIDDNGYKVSKLSLGSHNSTHIDAQSHMIPGGKTLSEYPIDRFLGDALYVQNKNNIEKSEIIIIDGITFTESLIDRIIELKPKMIGFSSDNDLNEKGIRQFLESDILPVGPLNIVEQLPQKFYFSATPLNIENGDGSPVRAIATLYD
jgi:arylformamidase